MYPSNGIITTSFSAGLCNRIYKWCALRAISQHYNMDILVDWPEIRDNALQLPDTYYYDPSKIPHSVFNPISTVGIENVSDLKLEPKGDYILTCGWAFSRKIMDVSVSRYAAIY